MVQIFYWFISSYIWAAYNYKYCSCISRDGISCNGIVYNKIDLDFIKKRFPGLIAGNVLGFITGILYKKVLC